MYINKKALIIFVAVIFLQQFCFYFYTKTKLQSDEALVSMLTQSSQTARANLAYDIQRNGVEYLKEAFGIDQLSKIGEVRAEANRSFVASSEQFRQVATSSSNFLTFLLLGIVVLPVAIIYMVFWHFFTPKSSQFWLAIVCPPLGLVLMLFNAATEVKPSKGA